MRIEVVFLRFNDNRLTAHLFPRIFKLITVDLLILFSIWVIQVDMLLVIACDDYAMHIKAYIYFAIWCIPSFDVIGFVEGGCRNHPDRIALFK